MAYIVIFGLLAIVTLASRGETGRATVVMCNSCSCKWNKLCRCTNGEISVYDNTVKGLCLNHTENMEERVLKPMRQSKLLERYEHETYIAEAMDKEEEKFKDEELLKNPATFSRWMRQHGMER